MEHKIQDLFEFIRNGANIKQGEPGGYPITRIETISSGEINRNKMGYAGLTDLKKYENYILEDQDLLMSHINSEKHLGKCAIYHKKDNEIIIHGMNLLGLRVKKEMILPKFAVYLFQTNKFKKSLSKIIKKSVNQASFAVNDLKKIKVDIPDIEQQQRIVSILDSCISLKRKRQSQITALDELTKSLFLEMFGDPRINPRAWDTKNLTQIVVKDKRAIKRGPFGGALKKEIFVDSGYLVYEQYHAINDDFTVNRYFITEEKYNELEAFRVMPGDLIVSCSGVTLGRIAEIPANAQEGIINQALLKLTLDTNVMNKEFFKFVFRSEHIQSILFSVSRGSGVPNLPSMSVMKQIEFLCPPIQMQNIFEEKISYINIEIFKLKESLIEMENLYNSLLQKAFKGELFQD